MAEDYRKAMAANDPNAEKLVAEFKKKLGKLAADSKAMKERHSADWKALGQRFRDQKASIYTQAEKGIQDAISGIKHAFRPK